MLNSCWVLVSYVSCSLPFLWDDDAFETYLLWPRKGQWKHIMPNVRHFPRKSPTIRILQHFFNKIPWKNSLLTAHFTSGASPSNINLKVQIKFYLNLFLISLKGEVYEISHFSTEVGWDMSVFSTWWQVWDSTHDFVSGHYHTTTTSKHVSVFLHFSSPHFKAKTVYFNAQTICIFAASTGCL